MDPLGPSGPSTRRRRSRWLTLDALTNLRYQYRFSAPDMANMDRDAVMRYGVIFSAGFILFLLLFLGILLLNVFRINNVFVRPLVSGLYTGFVQMDEARIRTTITVEDQLAIAFDLPLKKQTIVTLSEDTVIEGAIVSLRTGTMVISNAPATVTLPAGTELPVFLDLEIPVQTNIPVTLLVPVDIAVADTDLHEPILQLQQLFAPLSSLAESIPGCWSMALWGGDCG